MPNKNIPSRFSERLVTAFNAKEDITWQDLAKAAGCSNKELEQMKAGYFMPVQECLQKIADFLGVPVEYLEGKKAWKPAVVKPKTKAFSPRRLCNQIKDKGLTQKELAKKAGLDETAVSKYCLGRTEPQKTAILAMAHALGVKKEDLLAVNGNTEFKRKESTRKYVRKEHTVTTKLSGIRNAAGLTQRELAETLGVSQYTVSKWETGERAIPDKHVAELCDLFGVAEEYIVGVAGEEAAEPAATAEKPNLVVKISPEPAAIADDEAEPETTAEEDFEDTAAEETIPAEKTIAKDPAAETAPVTDIVSTLKLLNDVLGANDPVRCGKILFILQTIEGLDSAVLDKVCEYTEMVASFASR